MLEKERALREMLERTLKAAKDLSDRLHYAKLSETAAGRTQEFLDRLIALFQQDRIEALGQCLFANHQIRQECERLQDELDAREGRPTCPDPLAQVEPVLATLPPKQASALRMLTMLAASAPPAPETTDAFEKARIFIGEVETTLADLRNEAALLVEVGEEKARRGWVDTTALDHDRTTIERIITQADAALAASRQFLDTSLAEYDALSRGRLALRQALQDQVAR